MVKNKERLMYRSSRKEKVKITLTRVGILTNIY